MLDHQRWCTPKYAVIERLSIEIMTWLPLLADSFGSPQFN